MSDAHRFADVPQEVIDLVTVVRNRYFETLSGAQIKIAFDTKKRTSGGNIVFGRMQKANDLIRYLTDDTQAPQGFDFILYLDQNIYHAMGEADRTRLIFHELCHCGVDLDRKDPFYIIPHDVETFYAEIEYNKDNPRWYESMSQIAAEVYAADD